MVESTGLENQRTRKGIESSNLSLSVYYYIHKKQPVSLKNRNTGCFYILEVEI